jgi:hypothetical protein
MSDFLFQKSWKLEVKSRGPNEVELSLPGCRLPTAELPAYVAPGIPIEVSVTITAQHTYAEWARAYARQGAADLSVYHELVKLCTAGTIEDCHEMHYLQMAIEKLARAYMLKHSKGDRTRYLNSHVAVNDFAQIYVSSLEWAPRFDGNRGLWSQVKQLAGAIEELAPAVERQARPSNAEYPWSDGKSLTVPKDVAFRRRFSFPTHVWAQLTDMLEEISRALST